MSKNLIVLFIVLLLIVGGFGIYTYDQSNQVKKEVEEKNLKLESNDTLVLELKENLQEKEKQIEELETNLAKGEEDLEKEYADKLSELMEEKGKLGALLIEQEGISQTKDQEKEELISKLEDCNNQINEVKEKLVQQEIEGEKDYVAELSLLTEEKSKLETQLKTSQELLSERENAIALLKQQKEDSEKVISDKDKIMVELSESIKGYENLVKEIQEQMTQEGKEKEAEYTERLALLKEAKDTIEAKLAEAIKKNIPEYYEVEKGDSLWNITERFYSTGEKWIRILEANRDIIKNPSMIYPYQRFTIPKE